MKKIIITIGVLLVCVVVTVVLVHFLQEKTILKDIDASTIDRIEIWPNDVPAVLTTEEEINEVMDILKSVTLKKSFSGIKDGGLSIDIYFDDDEKMSITVLSGDIYVNGETYTCDENCVEEIRIIYEHIIE